MNSLWCWRNCVILRLEKIFWKPGEYSGRFSRQWEGLAPQVFFNRGLGLGWCNDGMHAWSFFIMNQPIVLMNQLSTISWKSWYLWYLARTASSCHWYAKRPNGPILWAFWRIDGGWVMALIMADKNAGTWMFDDWCQEVSLVIVLIHHQWWRDAWWDMMIHDNIWWCMMMHAQWSQVNDCEWLVVLVESVSWHSGMSPSPVLEWTFGYLTLGSLGVSNDMMWGSLKCRKPGVLKRNCSQKMENGWKLLNFSDLKTWFVEFFQSWSISMPMSEKLVLHVTFLYFLFKFEVWWPSF